MQQIGRERLVQLVRKTGHQRPHARALVGQRQLPDDLFALGQQGTQILGVLQGQSGLFLLTHQLLLHGDFSAVVLVHKDLHEPHAQQHDGRELTDEHQGVVPGWLVQIFSPYARHHGQCLDAQSHRQNQACPHHRICALFVVGQGNALAGKKVLQTTEGVKNIKHQHDGALG